MSSITATARKGSQLALACSAVLTVASCDLGIENPGLIDDGALNDMRAMEPLVNEIFYRERYELVPLICGVIAAAFVVRGFANYGQAVILSRIGNNLVARYQRRLFDHLRSFGIEPRIRGVPYDVAFAKEPFAEDERHASYDATSVARFHAVLRWTADVLEEFAGGYAGMTTALLRSTYDQGIKAIKGIGY